MINAIRNRKSTLILLLILTAFSLAGCSDKKEKKDTKTKQESTDKPGPTPPGAWATAEQIEEYEKALAATIKLEPSNGKYDLDKTAKIQEDNFRNFYHIFINSFCDSNGDGIGDIKGITSKLDYIAETGYQGIWITPFHESSTYHKYDVIDYYTVDSSFGTMADMEELIKECDKRGIKLIMDLVMNHTSNKMKWFSEGFNSIKDGTYKNNKYFNYYNFTQTKKDSTFYAIGTTGWFYEGAFTGTMPDVNLLNSDVRKEYEKIVDFWMAKGIGGFRLDAALHYVEADDDKNIEILKWFNDYVKAKDPDAYIVAEVWTNSTQAAEYYKSGIDSVFNFDIATGSDSEIVSEVRSEDGGNAFEKTLMYYEELVSKYSANSKCIDAPFLSNHDTARILGKTTDESTLKSIYAMIQMMKGATFTYYGDEIAMAGSGTSDVNYRAGMYWSNSNSTGIPKSPSGCTVQNSDHIYGSLEEQMSKSTSVYNYNKRLLQLRNENPEIARGTTAPIESIKDHSIIAVSKTYNGETIYLITNISKYPKQVEVKKSECDYSELYGYASGDDNKVTLDGETLTLPPASMVVLR